MALDNYALSFLDNSEAESARYSVTVRTLRFVWIQLNVMDRQSVLGSYVASIGGRRGGSEDRWLSVPFKGRVGPNQYCYDLIIVASRQIGIVLSTTVFQCSYV